jgi:hypothetical protein
LPVESSATVEELDEAAAGWFPEVETMLSLLIRFCARRTPTKRRAMPAKVRPEPDEPWVRAVLDLGEPGAEDGRRVASGAGDGAWTWVAMSLGW